MCRKQPSQKNAEGTVKSTIPYRSASMTINHQLASPNCFTPSMCQLRNARLQNPHNTPPRTVVTTESLTDSHCWQYAITIQPSVHERFHTKHVITSARCAPLSIGTLQPGAPGREIHRAATGCRNQIQACKKSAKQCTSWYSQNLGTAATTLIGTHTGPSRCHAHCADTKALHTTPAQRTIQHAPQLVHDLAG